MIEAAARQACSPTKNGKIGVLATSATIRSGKYEKTIHAIGKDIEVCSLACPELVPMIEAGKTADDPELSDIIAEYLNILKEKQADTVILALGFRSCTKLATVTNEGAASIAADAFAN